MNPSMFPPSPHVKPRRHQTGPLKLPALPRFHPANYQSPSSSSATTPASGLNSPQGQLRQYPSDAQRQLQSYQRDIFSQASRASRDSTGQMGIKPTSPKLQPLGSPGPVTPLMLEEGGGYMVAGAGGRDVKQLQGAGERDLVEHLIREESRRRSDGQSERIALVGGGH
ncbi:MAG: hypothetical protein M1819_002642 [Sarea resinae]|nr:MAG: hypothetical protein M1819_002642 [Sarea resinae]